MRENEEPFPAWWEVAGIPLKEGLKTVFEV